MYIRPIIEGVFFLLPEFTQSLSPGAAYLTRSRGMCAYLLFEFTPGSTHLVSCRGSGAGDRSRESRLVNSQQLITNYPFNQFGNQGKLLNLGNLGFDIVSDLELRISDFANLAPLHLSRDLYKSALICKTNPISEKVK
jgi:hypothetical protein